jgi:hypothetical protein
MRTGKKKEYPMTPAELIAAGELLYGGRWKSALARTVNYERESIHAYASGKRRIPPRIAAQIRVIVNIGPVGIVIRSTIRKIVPELPMFTAHRITRQILVDLHSLGILKGDTAVGDQTVPIKIVGNVPE